MFENKRVNLTCRGVEEGSYGGNGVTARRPEANIQREGARKRGVLGHVRSQRPFKSHANRGPGKHRE